MYSPLLITIVNVVFWFATIVFGAAIITTVVPERIYIYSNVLFRERFFERKLYAALRIKRWKDKLPIYRYNDSVFDRKHLSKEISREYLDTFIAETCKAEFVHIVLAIFGFSSIVFVFTKVEPMPVYLCIVIVMFSIHLPFIFVQRYNRQRLLKLLCRLK